MDGRYSLVKGYYRSRKAAIEKCALVALMLRAKVFAVQHQGWCATGRRAHVTYRRYGRSNRCRNGKGGPWANDVYRVYGKYFVLLDTIVTINFLVILLISMGSHLSNSRYLAGLGLTRSLVETDSNPLLSMLCVSLLSSFTHLIVCWGLPS